jgi:penicillin-binding protein 2
MSRFSNLTIKDHIRESELINKRILISAIGATILLAILLMRLFQLQIIDSQHYSSLSENNRVNLLPIPPTRGLIYDREGRLLAQNLPSFTLELVPEHIDNLQETLETLQGLVRISDDELKRFRQQLKRKRRFEGVPLRFRLNDAEVARVAVNQYRLPGVEIRAQLSRHYPMGSLASHAIGYVGRIDEDELRQLDASNYSATNHIGKVGVEKSYEHLLHGQVGFQRVETNAQGRILNILERTLPTPGKNLYLNLDARLQDIAEKGFGDDNGALVAIDPNNGAVLALVSVPTFDPNLFVNGIDTKSYNALSHSKRRPLFNRALRGQYPPGSTLKPFIGLAGLELDVVSPSDSINCPGYYMLKNDDRRYRDWKKQGHHITDLRKAIVESCDVYFYDLSLALQIDRLHTYLSAFGMGQPTGIDIRGELPGLMPSREWKRRTHNLPWFPGETLITGIGQGFTLTTPLQLASITATLADLGQRYQPQVLHAIQEPGTEALHIQTPVPTGHVNIAKIEHWHNIIDIMQDVVHSLHGTARRISHNLKYRVAAKTGTAQVFGIKEDEEYVEEDIAKKLRDHALFIAFAPAEKPRIAVAVIVENGGSGGAVAAPIARQVMDYYLLHSEADNHATE